MFGSSPAIRLTGPVVTEWLLDQQTLKINPIITRKQRCRFFLVVLLREENSRPEIPVDSLEGHSLL